MQVDAVVVAAGSSTRFGTQDKLFADLAGRSVLAWSLVALETAKRVQRIVVVAAAERLDAVAALGAGAAPSRFACAVPGGARRRDSVEAGLRACRSRYVA